MDKKSVFGFLGSSLGGMLAGWLVGTTAALIVWVIVSLIVIVAIIVIAFVGTVFTFGHFSLAPLASAMAPFLSFLFPSSTDRVILTCSYVGDALAIVGAVFFPLMYLVWVPGKSDVRSRRAVDW